MARKPTTPAAAVQSPAAPARLRLTRPFGFYDEGGIHRHWCAGWVASDPEEVLVLLERGAPITLEA